MAQSKKPRQSRSVSRLCAVQILFSQEQSQESINDCLKTFLENFAGREIEGDIYNMPDITLLSELVKGTYNNIEDIDTVISGNLAESWELSRMDSVLRSILRIGVYEILNHSDTPTAIIVNEYIELTKAFMDKKEASFVNGALDNIAKKIRG